MARNESETQPILKCPHCANEDIDYLLLKQMVPATLYILVDGNTIEADTQTLEMDIADGTGDCIACVRCERDFEIPKGFDITYA